MEHAAAPLLAWLCQNCHPHCRILLEDASIELVETLAFSPVKALKLNLPK